MKYKKLNLLFLLASAISSCLFMSSCKKRSLPVLTTTTAQNVQYDGAICGGTIISDEGSAITARGVCYSTTVDPTISDAKTVDGLGRGTFTSVISGLLPNTTYYVRAYAKNAFGTSYGNNITFKTLPQPVTLPVVTTTATPINITNDSATSGGTITSDGGMAITARGVCYGVNENPTVNGAKTVDGAGIGSFTSIIGSLSPNTIYHIRAYATNASGTAYGNDLSFKTLLAPPKTPVLTTTTPTKITQDSALSGGTITSDKGLAVTARGVCYSTTTNPTIADSKTVNGIGTGAFVSNISNLLPNTTYYVRAYATNSDGTGYGDEKSFTTQTVSVGGIYKGGIVFYVDMLGQHGLIAAPTDQSTGAQWGCYDVVDVMGTDTLIGKGKANTEAIITACTTAGTAAKICYDLVLNGYDDWFLPSKDELELAYQNLHKNGKGSFVDGLFYWSSSQCAGSIDPKKFAWARIFGIVSGDVWHGLYKDDPLNHHVRAIRAF